MTGKYEKIVLSMSEKTLPLNSRKIPRRRKVKIFYKCVQIEKILQDYVTHEQDAKLSINMESVNLEKFSINSLEKCLSEKQTYNCTDLNFRMLPLKTVAFRIE